MYSERTHTASIESSQPTTNKLDYDVLQEQIGFAAHRATLLLRRDFALQVSPVRPVMFSTLVLVGANPGVTQTELADALFLDKGTIAHLLRNLEKQGWIERNHRTADRRWKGVYLTPAGVQELNRLKAEVSKVSNRLRRLFTEEERAQLLEMLNRIVASGGVSGEDAD